MAQPSVATPESRLRVQRSPYALLERRPLIDDGAQHGRVCESPIPIDEERLRRAHEPVLGSDLTRKRERPDR